MSARNLMIVQGGGPTAVFNASLASAVGEAARVPGFGKVFGAKAGALGLSRGEVIDLTELPPSEVELLRDTPGAALGSSRHKPTEEELERELETLRVLDVHDMLFLGGNGTMRGAELFAAYCAARGHEMRVVGVPKTVDNDLAGTDRCPGYASAARYVAQSTQELGLDVRSLPQPVTILETMGRSVGWLAAAATLARVGEGDAPQRVYVPEIAFEEEAFLQAVEEVIRQQGWAVVVVAEGIRNRDGSMVYEMADPAQQDPLKRPLTGGVSQHLARLVAKNLRVRCRSEKPGLLGRASRAHRSEQDLMDAVMVGVAGVQALRAGEMGVMVGLTALGSDEATKLVPLAEVAGVERTIPEAWLNKGSMAVSEEFRTYLRPLVGTLNQYARELRPVAATEFAAVAGVKG
jgi:6-phosphofructokinase